MPKKPPFIDSNNPEYFAELLPPIVRDAHRRLPSHEQRPCLNIPGIQGVDGSLSRSLQTLLDVLADITLRERGNVSATMASLKDDHGTLESKLYIVFNRDLDTDEFHGCHNHLKTILNVLRQVPYQPPATVSGSLRIISGPLETSFIDFCKVIHEYSFDVFAYRVNKREKRLSKIREYIEQDQTKHFEAQERSKLTDFFQHVDGIILAVANAQATKQFTDASIEMIISIYSDWTEHNLLPDLVATDNKDKDTLLDKADLWLADSAWSDSFTDFTLTRLLAYGVDILLKRWAQKIMSFVISASRLFILTQSNRLRKVILGKFSVEILTSRTATPYSCDLSSEAIGAVLNDLLTGTDYLSSDYDGDRESFIDMLKEKLPDVVHRYDPTVHAELAMVMAMVTGEITHVLPYIGASKLSCIMCSNYIRAFNEVMGQTITIRGSHGKAYPGWSWPTPPAGDEELRGTFMKSIRQQFINDFEEYATNRRRRSDSSVGSGGAGVRIRRDISQLIGVVRAQAPK